MTNPEQREKIARAVYEAFPIRDEDGPWSWERVNHLERGNYDRAHKCWQTADAIIALDPAPESAIPAGMVAWHGGEEAPADWDAKARVLFRDGACLAWSIACRQRWLNTGSSSEIVAYTPCATLARSSGS